MKNNKRRTNGNKAIIVTLLVCLIGSIVLNVGLVLRNAEAKESYERKLEELEYNSKTNDY